MNCTITDLICITYQTESWSGKGLSPVGGKGGGGENKSPDSEPRYPDAEHRSGVSSVFGSYLGGSQFKSGSTDQ
jgi:hypothetical protein